MAFELEAAFIGAVVGAVGSYFISLRRERQEITKALTAFEVFHEQFGAPNSTTDLVIMKEGLRSIAQMILLNGYESKVKHFMAYSGRVELMVIKVVANSSFQSIVPDLKAMWMLQKLIFKGLFFHSVGGENLYK